MPDTSFRLRRTAKAFTRRMRELRTIARGAMGTDHPIMAHIIPIRRCNLSCTYCNEYDDFSKPVPTDVMIAPHRPSGRPGHQHHHAFAAASRCCTPNSTKSSPPSAAAASIAGMITNGYLLTADRIKRLNRAGLDHMQISHRQRQAGRRVEEEPQGARQEAADAGRARRISRQHQLGGRRRHSQS